LGVGLAVADRQWAILTRPLDHVIGEEMFAAHLAKRAHDGRRSQYAARDQSLDKCGVVHRAPPAIEVKLPDC
jgi:hypothetical protein